MEQKNKRTYQELLVEIKQLESDLIRTSTAIEQTEIAIKWKRDSWSDRWDS